MSCYGPLAQWYDALTGDVPYGQFADFYESVFSGCGPDVHTVLDLACGTGNMTLELAARGYEMIAVDGSADMLGVAAGKASAASGILPPLFLCQDMAGLDLYGTVDAAVSCLDSFNYLPAEVLPEVLRRLHLFIVPGGALVFDIHTPERLRSLDGQVSVDETDDVFCLWRAQFDEAENALFYGMDIFTRAGGLWRREVEEHIEYAHDPGQLAQLLAASGFADVCVRRDGPLGESGRIFITAKNCNH